MRSQFYPGQFGKSLQSSLGHPISSQTAMSLMPCNRRHDDHSTFYIIPDHRFCSFLTKKKTSLQVEMYLFMKLTHLILQNISKCCNTGIGYHIVNASEITIYYTDHSID